MTARIGADDVAYFETPLPDLLHLVTGISPEGAGDHVRLDLAIAARSTQRLGLAEFGDTIVAALWPAELKPQAEYLYGERLAEPMIAAARGQGWKVWPALQLAFHNSRPAQRIYISATIDATEYARRWSDADRSWIGQHSREDVSRSLWPWLKASGYVLNNDDSVLEKWLNILGRRAAHLRPGLRMRRQWPANQGADAIRSEVNVILAAAGEPGLPPNS